MRPTCRGWWVTVACGLLATAACDCSDDEGPGDMVDGGSDAGPGTDAGDAGALDSRRDPDGGTEVLCPEASETACSEVCVETDTDPRHCGGMCVCEDPTTDCSGLCVNTTIDPSHCGACDAACMDGRICRDSTCSCPVGGECECRTPM